MNTQPHIEHVFPVGFAEVRAAFISDIVGVSII
jgi:hypothetical protein